MSTEQLEFAKATISRLNPRAVLMPTMRSNAHIDMIVKTGLFSFAETTASGE